MEQHPDFYIPESTELASQGQRVANFFIDYLMQLFIGFLIGILAVMLGLIVGNNDIAAQIENMSKLQEYALGILILFVYYCAFESFGGRTIGKLITGTQVVGEFGEKPDARTILIRTLCRCIPFDFLSFLGDSGRGWHDSISKTYVIRKKIYLNRINEVIAFDEIGENSDVL